MILPLTGSWKYDVIGFITILYIWETYIKIRQYKKVCNAKIPKQLEEHIDEEKLEKTKAYQKDNYRFSFITDALDYIENILIIHFNILPLIWGLSEKILVKFGYNSEYEILQSLVFMGIFMVINYILNLPPDLYNTFVIESKHGFNNTTLKLYVIDEIKTCILAVVFGVPLISIFLKIIQKTGDAFYLYIWIFMAIVQLLILIIYPNFIQPLFNKFTPLEEGELKTQIEEIAKSVNYPLKKLYVVDNSKRSGHSNAYLFGLGKNKRIVLYDTLLKQVNNEEICSILGHELGHWYNSHNIKLLAFGEIQIFIIFYIFSHLINYTPLYKSFGFDVQPILIGFILFSFIFTPIDSLLDFIMNVYTRYFERQADEFAAVSLKRSDCLISGLIKIHIENLSNLIVDPLYSAWNYSHPPLLERIDHIKLCQENMNKKKE
ncbi:hypothetical protein BCR32DRAFT_326240 [Anaeromyces robustus]|uniref:CAAX prenyl protease n=1 Tax=Anaeromyces robustus TaxID=1754192 RepID=A0A1Y1XDP0_9FUNG|nr:hypothetical protein BCR32DRAFT_326240 [Anaeromyces robustus]|eukprot:ORX83812.1 hypothetical protein BCR32DRAFT_326240 [Anaeromyces robustus]